MRKCRSFRQFTSSSRSAVLSSFETFCLPVTGAKSAEFCDAVLGESDMSDAGDAGRDGGGRSEWIKSDAYFRIRGSREVVGRHQSKKPGLQWLQHRSGGGWRLRSRTVQLSSCAELCETGPDLDAMGAVKLL
jgi:hypothetical protein